MSPRKYGLVSLVVAVITLSIVLLIAQEPALAASKASPGTTISVTKTAQTHLVQKTSWGIAKTVSPTSIDLFTGDSVVAHYQITATKTVSQVYRVQGQICVTNGGSVATQGLVIFDHVQYKVGSGQYMDVPGATKTITPATQILAGQTVCYPYSIDFAAPVPNATYRNAVDASITNHSGTLGTPFPTSYRIGITFPSVADVPEGYSSINVSDTLGGSHSFSTTGTWSYTRTYSCDADSGGHSNTASIDETGATASASIALNCYSLQVSKTVSSANIVRQWTWAVDKEAYSILDGTQIYYTITLTADNTLYDVAIGSIHVHNPAPVGAEILSITDTVPQAILVSVDCGSIEFPYTLASGDDLDCTYSATLPNTSTRTNTANAYIQNYVYDTGDPSLSGTTGFSGTASINFGASPSIVGRDECATVQDVNSLGTTIDIPQYCVTGTTANTVYAEYYMGLQGACTGVDISNTATFTTNDDGATASATKHITNAGGTGFGTCQPSGSISEPLFVHIRQGGPPPE